MAEPVPDILFLALPSYNGWRRNIGPVLEVVMSGGIGVRVMEATLPLLALCFNSCWVAALNARAEGVTHFLMLHADVLPRSGATPWHQVLLAEMAETGADVLSAVVAIKNANGATSTAIDVDQWHQRGLMLAEVAYRPETWTEPGLLVNTGCLLVDLRKPWVDRVCFTVNDRIVQTPEGWKAECEPEDWGFSRQARALGAAIYATRKVEVFHYGETGYPNHL